MKPEALFDSTVYKSFVKSQQTFSTAREIKENNEEDSYDDSNEESYKKYLKDLKVDLMKDRFKLVFSTSNNKNEQSSINTYPLINKGILKKGVLYQEGYVYMPMNYVIKMINENNSNCHFNHKMGYDVAFIKIETASGMKEILKTLEGAGYQVEAMNSILKEFKQFINILQMAFGAVAAISLIVASIGITNTMIMSVNERTKEIGVMKVIGATIQDIKNLFLLESAIIGALGGALGVVIAIIAAKIINLVITAKMSSAGSGNDLLFSFSIPLWLIAINMIFTILIGILSGYLPARKAMRCSALEAIKNG